MKTKDIKEVSHAFLEWFRSVTQILAQTQSPEVIKVYHIKHFLKMFYKESQ